MIIIMSCDSSPALEEEQRPLVVSGLKLQMLVLSLVKVHTHTRMIYIYIYIWYVIPCWFSIGAVPGEGALPRAGHRANRQ